MSWSKWYLFKYKYKETLAWRIRRQSIPCGANSKWEQYKVKDFNKHCSEAEAKRFVLQLNIRDGFHLKNAKENYEFKHAFITPTLIDDFRTHLLSQVASKDWGIAYFNYFIRHGLKWFIQKNNNPDPIQWKLLEELWGKALMGNLEGKEQALNVFTSKVHPGTIKKQITVMNRFLVFIHKRIPTLVPYLQLEPISKAVMKDYTARYSLTHKVGQYITPEDWLKIKSEISAEIKPFVLLAYNFGLRRAESLAIKKENIRKGFLEVTEQIVHHNAERTTYAPLKNREVRKIEYWFMSAKEVYTLVEALPNRLSPDWYGHCFESEMKRLGLRYHTHDLRRTFITNAFRAGKNHRDIQLAAGHTDITTTMKYAMDDREISDADVYKPEDAA